MGKGLEPLTRLLGELDAKQRLVFRVVRRCVDMDWEAAPAEPLLDAERSAGSHFRQYPAELVWSPQAVVGHLIDFATTSAQRIDVLRSGSGAALDELVTDEPERLRRYARSSRTHAMQLLDDASQRLIFRAAAVRPNELDHWGFHPRHGQLRLRDVMSFLPAHHAEHAHQLVTLAGSRT